MRIVHTQELQVKLLSNLYFALTVVAQLIGKDDFVAMCFNGGALIIYGNILVGSVHFSNTLA